MAGKNLDEFLRCLTRGMAAETLADHSDRQLVERALAKRHEAAFQVIVCRHGPMVYRVCWRVLEHPQDAEDAFQATFLVLAQKLPTLRKHASLASWLHGIAHRVALKAKAEVAARRRREHLASHPGTGLPDDVTWGELRSALDGELSRLPDKWRQPLILCYLEGRTQEESANQLGWSKSTLRRRLEEARTALAERLKRRGIVLPAALSALLLSDCLAWAAPVPGLVAATAEAAAGAAAGNTVAAAASAKAAALAEGVLKAMFLTKLKLTATLLLVVGIATCATASFHFQFLTAEEPKKPAAKTEARAVPKPTDKQTQLNEGSDDAKRLQGEWQAVDGEKGGKPLAEEPTEMRITFKGDKFTGLGDGNMKFTLDTGKSPRELNIHILDGKLKGQTIRMIYSLEKDELKLCLPLGPEIPCPKEFKTKPGSNLLLLVLRRAPKDAAAVKRLDDLANVKREWRRADAAPDGNYKLSYVWQLSEETVCLIKLETKDGKESASLVDTFVDEVAGVRDEVTDVRVVEPTMRPPSGSVGQGKAVPIRLVCRRPRADLIFEGTFFPPSLEARGHLEVAGMVHPATLVATDLTKLKFTTRGLPVTPLQKALLLTRKLYGLRRRAEFAKDSQEKAGLMKEAALAEKAALAEAPKLLREGFEKPGDDPLIFGAAVDAARYATRYQIPADELRAMIAKADKAAASYGRGWQREFHLQIASALGPQKDFAALALDIATRLEKELVPADAAATRGRVLKALAAAEANAGGSAAVRETLAGLLAKVEETLDREYRAKVPPFKPVLFTGRKAGSDRAVVLELFTSTQCPPCVAAAVAFDALHETYRPSELVRLQYHLQDSPGPDPLANPDSEARMNYYSKSFPAEIRGFPATLFNGKPQAGGGGDMTQAEVKYKQYRQVIEPLLETIGAAKLSASAVKQGNKVIIKVEVSDLKKPGHDIRLRLLLVEETVRYVGSNRVRFHDHVVRSMIGGADGFALNDKDSKHTTAVDLDVLRKSLGRYLDDYNSNREPFPNADRPLDLSDLRLIALVQDDATREIIQATEAEIIAQGKTATGK